MNLSEEPCDSTVKTEIGHTFKFLWTIKKFTTIFEQINQDKCIRSPLFNVFDSKINLRIVLRAAATIAGINTGKQVGLIIEGLHDYYDYCIAEDAMITLQIDVLKHNKIYFTFKDGINWHYFDQNKILDRTTESTAMFSFGPRANGPNESIFGGQWQSLGDESVTISCQVTKHLKENMIKKTDEERRLIDFDKFEMLLQNKEHSDVVLVVEGEEIHAHKCILSNSSPVFAAMFKHDMSEKNKNRVDITDYRVVVMKELLRYVYSGKVGDIKSMAFELFLAAEKYFLDGLKDIIENVMCCNINEQNMFDYITFSNDHAMRKLKVSVIQYIAKNKEDLISLQ